MTLFYGVSKKGWSQAIRHAHSRCSSRKSNLQRIAAMLALVPLCASGGNGIIDEVSVSKEDDAPVIEILFRCPVRYTTHFPQESGDELRVRVKPVRACGGDLSATLGRETMRPRNGDLAKLTEVTYEGETPGSGFVSLYFTQPVEFSVQQGSDFRSISIRVNVQQGVK